VSTRKRVRGILRPFLAAFCGIMIALPVAIVALDYSQPITDQDWFDRVNVCRPKNDSTYQIDRTVECVEKVVVLAAKDEKLLTVAKAITDIAAEDVQFWGMCHGATHRIGKELLELYGSAEESLRAASTIDCGNGLAHGIMDYWAAEPSTQLSSFPSVIKACEETELIHPGGCAEGIGHAAYQHQEDDVEFNRRLDIAFTVCEQFNNHQQSTHCGYGVMMQPHLKENDIVITEDALPIPKNGELITICDGLSHRDDVVDGCNQSAGWLMGVRIILALKGGELQKLKDLPGEEQNEAIFSFVTEEAGFCVSNTAIHQRNHDCLIQYFARFPLVWYEDTDALERRCARLPVDRGFDFEKYCYAGAYESTPPGVMLALMRRHPEIVDMVRERWVRERGDELLAEFKKTTAPNTNK
jgi:hypothetical protein